MRACSRPCGGRPGARPGWRLVGCPAHDRVAETKSPRDVGLACDAHPRQCVYGLKCGRTGHAGGCRNQLGLEDVAHDGRGLARGAVCLRQLRELACQRAGQDGRDPGKLAAVSFRVSSAIAAGELLEVERVPTALGHERVQPARAHAASNQLGSLGARERSGLDQLIGRAGDETRLGAARPLRQMKRAVGERQQHRCPGRATDQVRHQLERGVIRPVQVVDHDDERPAGS